jgi:hypothetical protein
MLFFVSILKEKDRRRKMTDDKNIRHPHDGKRIDINDPYEVRNWCNIFNVSEEKLRQAVRAVGDSSEAVRRYLGK